MRTEDIGTEVFFLPVAAHTEKSGSFTNTQRLLQWHHQAVEPAGDARSDLQFTYDLGRRIRAKLAASTSETDRPVLDLTWDYPTGGPHEDPDADAVLAEINGRGPDGQPLSAYTQLKADGSTSCGCWIYCGVRADGVNQAARRKPHDQQTWVAPDWGWAWPANRRILYNRASADPRRQAVERPQGAGLVGRRAGRRGPGRTCPTSSPTGRPPTGRPRAPPASPRSRAPSPFIMQADGKAWLFAPAGLVDGPLPAHYEPQESPFRNLVYGQQHNPVRQIIRDPDNRYQPSGDEPGSGVFPYVTTTYRLTEHHTAGGMSRFLPLPVRTAARILLRGLAAARRRARPRASGLGDDRHGPHARSRPGCWSPSGCGRCRCRAGRCTRSGCPGTGGRTGTPPATPPTSWRTCRWIPNVHIQEVKAMACDVRPGRRPARACAARARPDLPEAGRHHRRDRDGDVRWMRAPPEIPTPGRAGNGAEPGRS